jgi:Leucine-rich repeat (LRR) protein
LSEAVKQNYGDIKNITSEVDSVKQALDALYVQFTGIDSQKNDVIMRRRSSTVRHIFGWIAGVTAVTVLLALTIVFLFFTPQHQPSPVPEHVSPTTSPANSDNEHSMLTELFNYLRPEKDFQKYFNFTAPHCSWEGITCNETTGRVIAINLGSFSLIAPESPSFPDSLGNFTDLKVLDLSNNMLFGAFPEPIVRLKNLVSLKLQHNKLTGFIPDLHNLSKLQILWLFANQFQGPLDMLMQLPALESLVLQQNLLSLELPQNISKSLLQLDVMGCDLHGTIPESWASSSLTSIDLSLNKLNGSVPCFGPDLISLVARYNQLDGQFCGQSLRSIQELDISSNKLTGTFDLPGVNVTNMTLLIQINRFTSFMPSSRDLTLAPALCSANYNEFKCPIPAWSAEKCQAECWPAPQ